MGRKHYHCILFALGNCHHEKTDANYHIPLLDLKSGVGRARAGKNRIFPLIVRRAVIQSKKGIGQSGANTKGVSGDLTGYGQDARYSIQDTAITPVLIILSFIEDRVSCSILFILPDSPLKSRQGVFNGAVIHAKRNAKVAGSVKTGTGNHQDTLFFESIHKFNIIRNR